MSVGAGYEYLMRSVVRGDAETLASTPLTRYYAESGTPPGRFLGAGLAGLNDGAGVAAGSQVSEEALFRLLGMIADPVTGQPLGRCVSLTSAGVVAGFDLTFSVPKSVSALWALADVDTQSVIYRAHQDAIATAIGWAEQHVFFTRRGAGGAIQDTVRGVVAAGFDHWDSRAGDPHLHTHVVIANRAQSADGRWRALDSRTLFRYVVALSELHEGVLQDLLSHRLGVGWDERTRRHSAVPRHDIAGVPDSLIREFSQRSTQIEDSKNQLIAGFVAKHGRHPSDVEVLRLRQQATLQTRPNKQHRTLREQTAAWRQRAQPSVGADTVAWARGLTASNLLPVLHAADLTDAMLAVAADVAVQTVAAKRATFSHANVLAQVHRQLHGTRFATPADRLTVAERTTGLALEQALPLTPPALEPVSAELRRPDGTSKLRHRGAELYTTREILDAEARLLNAGQDRSGPVIPASEATQVVQTSAGQPSQPLTGEQAAAVHAIATSGRVLDLLVGPAGTGKTSTLATLRQVWETGYGPGSVIGLAPSATAAQVLGEELGIASDNTAKWLTEQRNNPRRRDRIETLTAQLRRSGQPGTVLSRRRSREIHALRSEQARWTIRPGQLLVIDEASLAGTLTLDAIVTQTRHAGGKVLLVGDWAQLSAIDAGGAFTMLARDRPDTPHLNQVHRFTHDWERDASVRLRVGDKTVIDTYRSHDRLRAGDRDAMLDALYTAWRQDTQAGLTSLMIAADRDAVTELNRRAQADRNADTQADGRAVGWVKNGDTWTVLATGRHGTLRVQRTNGASEITLPCDYVRDHVELGYATTTHRAQGRTVDTAHALINTTATREMLYVAATRGRHTNTLYLDTHNDPDEPTSHGPTHELSAEHVLRTVLDRSQSDTSAHAALRRELQRADAETTHALSHPAAEMPIQPIGIPAPSAHHDISQRTPQIEL